MKKKFKVLYLDINRYFVNPDNANFLKVLSNSAQVTKYGPGYSEPAILNEGVENFINKNDSFDFVVTEHMSLFWHEDDPLRALRNESLGTSLELCSDYLIDIKRFFKTNRSHHPKKFFYCNFDPYNISIENIKFIDNSNCYLIAKDHKFWYHTSELNDLKYEKFQEVNDNWYEFLQLPSTKRKVVSYLPTLDVDEFYNAKLDDRTVDISVPGVEYYSRIKAIRCVKESTYNFKIGTHASGLKRKLLSRLMQFFKSKKIMKLYQALFSKGIQESKTCFTCGSALKYIVRKFFEIPAKGALLLCEPIECLKHIGFKDGTNCIFVQADKLDLKLFQIINNKEKSFQNIADNGRKLMQELHSIEKRSEQFYEVMTSIDNNDFIGSEFIYGSQKIHENK